MQNIQQTKLDESVQLVLIYGEPNDNYIDYLSFICIISPS